MTWWMYAFASALAASATAILAKIGIEGVPSNLATAVRTVVVLVFAWGIVFATREHLALPHEPRRRGAAHHPGPCARLRLPHAGRALDPCCRDDPGAGRP